MDTFYGVILPAVAGNISEGDYRGLVIHAAVFGVVVGADGRRLTDESAGGRGPGERRGPHRSRALHRGS